MSMLSIWTKKIEEKKIELTILEKQKDKLEDTLIKKQKRLETKEEAHAIVQTAAQMTQKVLEEQLGSVVSLALAAVFEENPYKFVVDFVQRRGTTECDLYFERKGELLDPLCDAGLGAADIASSTLRVSYWSSGETRPVLMVDEPCKNLSRDYQAAAAIMFKELCHKLGLQMIVVTHIPDFRERCDKMFLVQMDSKGKSTVEERTNART